MACCFLNQANLVSIIRTFAEYVAQVVDNLGMCLCNKLLFLPHHQKQWKEYRTCDKMLRVSYIQRFREKEEIELCIKPENSNLKSTWWKFERTRYCMKLWTLHFKTSKRTQSYWEAPTVFRTMSWVSLSADWTDWNVAFDWNQNAVCVYKFQANISVAKMLCHA